MRVRLLACDLDGTTLTSGRVPHPSFGPALERAQAAGIRVVFASGRIRPSMSGFAEEFGIDEMMVCSNGAHVVGTGRTELAIHALDKSVVGTVAKYAAANNVHVNVYSAEELLFINPSPWTDLYESRLVTITPRRATFEEAMGLEIIKVSIVDDPEKIPGHLRSLTERLDPNHFQYTESEAEYLEFMHPAANKGNGLRVLSEHLGLIPQETAAIGDYYNDLEMLQFAGVAGTVANGVQALKDEATVVTPSNDEGGVAWFIDYLIRL
jgi:Cof subfamily protein (haloacid dehalogenase superfamily)